MYPQIESQLFKNHENLNEFEVFDVVLVVLVARFKLTSNWLNIDHLIWNQAQLSQVHLATWRNNKTFQNVCVFFPAFANKLFLTLCFGSAFMLSIFIFRFSPKIEGICGVIIVAQFFVYFANRMNSVFSFDVHFFSFVIIVFGVFFPSNNFSANGFVNNRSFAYRYIMLLWLFIPLWNSGQMIEFLVS